MKLSPTYFIFFTEPKITARLTNCGVKNWFYSLQPISSNLEDSIRSFEKIFCMFDPLPLSSNLYYLDLRTSQIFVPFSYFPSKWEKYCPLSSLTPSFESLSSSSSFWSWLLTGSSSLEVYFLANSFSFSLPLFLFLFASFFFGPLIDPSP